MNEERQIQVFSRNLKRYMSLKNIKQCDMVNDLGYKKQTVSSWVNSRRIPRASIIQELANYLEVNVSDLLLEKTENTDNVVISTRKPTVNTKHNFKYTDYYVTTSDNQMYIEYTSSNNSKNYLNYLNLYLTLSEADRRIVNELIERLLKK